MKPATSPRAPLDARLLRIDPCAGTFADASVRDLPSMFRAGDLLVVNDAATFPASLPGAGPSGRPLEVRLVAEREDGAWDAVLFGPGSWRTATENREPPEPIDVGDSLRLGPDLSARVTDLSPLSRRLVTIRFDVPRERLWPLLYATGHPVQYSYLSRDLALRDVQTRFATRPVAAEPPSAGRPLTWSTLLALKGAGVGIAPLTHATGLSATGDPELDRALPLPERFEIPGATLGAIRAAKERGGRVVAGGTTVARALEGAARLGNADLTPRGVTDLVLGPDTEPRVVDGLLSGVHEPGSSHYAVLGAFVPEELLAAAAAHAEAAGYLCHEFGDSTLVLGDSQGAL
jgi:S-adenosylmethionine:tRNA ribosyltransferase-isomerase